MRTPLSLLIGASVLALAGAANATDLDYEFAEVRYLSSEFDDVNADGFRLNLSVPLTESFLFLAGGSSQELDLDLSVDVTTMDVGVGYVYRFNDVVDFYGEARLVSADAGATALGLSGSDTGYSVAAGVRGVITERFEARANVRQTDVLDSDTYFELGGDFYVMDNVAVGITAELGGDVDAYTAGVRWFFGN